MSAWKNAVAPPEPGTSTGRPGSAGDIGINGLGGPDPTALLTDFELEAEDVFSPPPNHPVLGTPYAIPVDGSSVTVDLVRSESGAAAGVACGRAVDPA